MSAKWYDTADVQVPVRLSVTVNEDQQDATI